MNKLRLLSFLFATLFVVTFSSCGDDEDDVKPSASAMLTAGIWQANEVFVDGIDFSQNVDLENTNIIFNSDGTYVFELNGDTQNGTWELTSNDQKILLDEGRSDEITADILQLTNSNLDIELTETDPDTGDDTTFEFHFIRD